MGAGAGEPLPWLNVKKKRSILLCRGLFGLERLRRRQRALESSKCLAFGYADGLFLIKDRLAASDERERETVKTAQLLTKASGISTVGRFLLNESRNALKKQVHMNVFLSSWRTGGLGSCCFAKTSKALLFRQLALAALRARNCAAGLIPAP